MHDSLQLREVFHLEFLRWLGRKIKIRHYALKGGSNLRFFFNSFRYSEDMDLDIRGINVDILKDAVMKILQARLFQDILNPFGIERVVPPNIARAKQTETTQRFKIHLITPAGEDLFSKIEFSRRGFDGKVVVEPVASIILREYRLPPLLVAHYDIKSALIQKINALSERSAVQARDIFDLYILSSQYRADEGKQEKMNTMRLNKAYENIFAVGFEQFRDTVICYLSGEEQTIYKSASVWDEIKLKTSGFIEELKNKNA